ncbi:transcription antitermination factor NusB [Leptobacterium flavescens]|uniref:Transcription antitermination factor NusB n=2 Tax=Leptobacterium flavescens TaxID=472055 RepID=A0A6P0UG69_9FLAO|nr:transcription antitermination factor NusB [Leptobacterium flavescens]
MQSIYALIQSKNTDMQKEEKFLTVSMENMYNLYVTLLNLIIAVQKLAEDQLLISQKKYLATEAEKNPNKKFINNEILQYLKENTLLQNITKERRLTDWDLEEDYVKLIYKEILESPVYEEYMKTEKSSFAEDKDLIIEIFKTIIAPNDKLYEYIEDNRLTWVDDLPLVNTLILKIFKKLKPEPPENYFTPKLFKDMDDKEFSRNLFRKTILNDEKFQEEIIGKTPNWDAERITEIDSILLKMAICEFHKFPSIPVKVTINEYLEIAKEYSTPKSSIFINGVLDKLVKDYTTNNSLNKSGRGLM